MKKIKLPIYETYSMRFNHKPDGAPEPVEGTVKFSVKKSSSMAKAILDDYTGKEFIELDIAKGNKELSLARENGGMVIYATIQIERVIERIVADYLFGNVVPNPKRDFFINHIMQTSHITYASKKALLLEIAGQLGLFSFPANDSKLKKQANKEKNEFDKLLRDAMSYRNAFAHGDLRYDASDDCVLLHYFSGSHREYKLDDSFWTKLEEEYTHLNEILRDIHSDIKSITNKTSDKETPD